LQASDPGLRRVSVHAGTTVIDLALPAGVPVAILISSIVDILKGREVDGPDDLEARRYHLSRPGESALDTSTTLAQNDIRDGAVLVLNQPATPPPAPRYDDVAEAVSATLDGTARPSDHSQHRKAARLTGALAAGFLTGVGGLALIRNALGNNIIRGLGTTASVAALAGLIALLFAMIAHRAYRDPIAGLALSVIATAFAGVAGFLVVPGTPGIPNVLLGATAAAVTSVLAMRVSGCGVVTLTAVSCVALVVAVAALVGVFTAAPLRAIGSASVLISLGLLGAAARVSIMLAGLSPRLPPSPGAAGACLAGKAIRADNWLTSLLTAFASSAAVGAIITVLAGAPRLSCIAFGTVTGALLFLRARSVDAKRMLVFVISGIAITATTFGVVALSTPQRGALIAAVTAVLAAAAIYLGFIAAAVSPTPLVRRSVEALECLALVAMVPLTCWICGLYSAVRGLNLK
jgi:ESX secretion system protein EccD